MRAGAAAAPIGSITSADRPIGVFDSGVGGLSVLRALRAELPQEDFVYFADSGNAPYGERDDAFVAQRSQAIAQQLREEHGIKALVVACNTATAAAVHLLRAGHPGLPLVGVEPALKPAAARSRTRRIAVLATRGTLASAKFAALHASLRDEAEFLLQPCDGLAAAIEADDATKIRALCEEYTRASGRFGSKNGQIDSLVLGCTHYPFAANHFAELAGPEVALIETGEPVARQTRRLLGAAGLLRTQGVGSITLQASAGQAALHATATRWLGR
ncbi:glutamate racemase [uncultured Ramlibacter sp.]|uniref:glutamate racemase n=1 Tax=uncultured Ramlibacter sp. TaxID=260755 RepID=UPI0026388143|nr:glutamate racemase [uncultured Ramlibacter sp.]